MTDEPKSGNAGGGARRGAINAGTFLVVFLFVWLVFDNLALGLLFGLVAGAGSVAAQRTAAGKADDAGQ